MVSFTLLEDGYKWWWSAPRKIRWATVSLFLGGFWLLLDTEVVMLHSFDNLITYLKTDKSIYTCSKAVFHSENDSELTVETWWMYICFSFFKKLCLKKLTKITNIQRNIRKHYNIIKYSEWKWVNEKESLLSSWFYWSFIRHLLEAEHILVPNWDDILTIFTEW